MSLMDEIMSKLGGNTMSQLSRHIGSDEQKTSAATGAAVSTLLAALSSNASNPDGARALTDALAKDHDGRVLDDVAGSVTRAQSGPGEGILRHVLGNRRANVERNLGRATGVDGAAMGKLMTALAPVVMGALGRKQREQNFAPSEVAGLLGQERSEIERSQPAAKGIFGSLLDTDGDGDVDMRDLARHGKGLLGKLLGR